MSLFEANELAFLAAAHPLGAEDISRKLEVLGRLQARRADGLLTALCETAVEQTFNERLFAEVFDYATLLRDGKGDYHLWPKKIHKDKRSGRWRYDDFSLGFFGAAGGEPLVVAELKDPGADLDRPQKGKRYRGQSPVQQGHAAAEKSPSVKWVIVSNFDEMRLYRAGNQGSCERVFLSTISGARELQLAHALFSRRTLLGEPGAVAPLFSLLTMEPTVLPHRPGAVRVLHHAQVQTPLWQEAAAHDIDDALLRWRSRGSSDFPPGGP
jgi:hypothetical protein